MVLHVTITDFEGELRLLNRSEETIKGYVSTLKSFLNYFNRNPKTITTDEIKGYLLTLPVFKRKTSIASIKFFYKHCVGGTKLKKLEYPTLPEYVPVILSPDEVKSLITTATNIKHRTIIMLMYSTAMRVSEVINLKWPDIDRKNEQIKIVSGKGKKDRIVRITPKMIKQLETYCRAYKNCDSKGYIFQGMKKAKYSKRSIAQFLNKYAEMAGIKKKVTPHLLRHCAGTHWRNSGVDLATIKDIMGHKHISTTEIYSKLTNLKNVPDLV